VKTWLGEIPLVTYRTIEFQTVASGSPTKPFSEYFDTYMPSKINAIGGLSPEIRYSVQDYDKRLREITNLGNQANAARADAFNATHGLGGYGQGQPGANAYGAATSNQFADRISAQAADLLSSLNADVWRAQQQSGQRTSGPGANAGGSGGGGGGGGDVNVNIDLSGATLSREFLDEELIPALERGVIRATGKDPNLRVFS
jgi:hypothetical protein